MSNTTANYNLSTYLCDYVKELIDSVNDRSTTGLDENLIYANLNLIDADYIAGVCVKYENNDNLIDYYTSSKLLSQNLSLIVGRGSCGDDGVLNFETNLKFISKFITQEADFDLIKSLTANTNAAAVDQQIRVYMSLLNVFVIFEKYLRQLVLTLNNGNCLNQFLLRDLIANKALETVFSRGFIDLMKCLVGSPYSLNLRNLLWHGFLQLDECSRFYTSFMLLILNRIGYELDKNGVVLQVQARKLESFKIRSIDFDEAAYEKVYTDIEQNIDTYAEMINEATLISESHKCLFLHTINSLFLQQKSFIQVIIALLPQIEFLLRKLYIIENNLDFKFNLSAQEKFFYLTMDEILLENVITSNTESKIMITKLTGSESEVTSVVNKLRLKLGDTFMLLLNDLFMYNDGPRIRDRLSHGEYELAGSSSTHGLYAAACVYSILTLSTRLNLNFITTYKCAYHPLACVKYDFIDLLNYFELNSGNTQEQQQQFSQCYKLIVKQIGVNFHTYNDTGVSLVKNFLTNSIPDSKYLYLFSTKKISCYSQLESSNNQNALQIINLIKHLIKECIQFLDTVYSYHEATRLKQYNKQLRARQRDTFEYFEATFLKELNVKIYEFLLFIAYLLLLLHSPLFPFDAIVKQFRKILSLLQNLSQQSKINRWLECNQLINELDNAIAMIITGLG